ncbi:lyase family protein [Zhihengliuella halotolerans]|uniref:lyase family protein n=1 Tax=Zhihengliuella halotolerans TaxID=370736 RepID=UPI000C801AF9|nr:lyase family protein [Zhihengliuella halotolerans]
MSRFTDGRVGDAGLRKLLDEENRYRQRLRVEAALAAAQARVGIIPEEAAEAIESAVASNSVDFAAVRAGVAKTSHPLMALVEELAAATGPKHGGWVHWGATTQNITQTADLLILKECHQLITGLIERTVAAASSLAESTATTAIAGRTHGQHGVPTTFGFKVSIWLDQYLRHLERLDAVGPRLFQAMMGGAVGNYAAMGEAGPRIQDEVGAALGLGSMPVPSRAIGDSFAEMVTLLGLVAGTSSHVAREVFTLMKPEFGEAFEPIPSGIIGSSTMPHKRNPQLCQDILSISAEIRSLVPLALEGMLEDHEVDGAATAMRDGALGRAVVLGGDLLIRVAVVLEGLELDEERMKQNLHLTQGLIASESIMMALAEHLGRQAAHDVVYEAAQAASMGERSFVEILMSDRRIARRMGREELELLLDPARPAGLSVGIARSTARRATATLASRARQ